MCILSLTVSPQSSSLEMNTSGANALALVWPVGSPVRLQGSLSGRTCWAATDGSQKSLSSLSSLSSMSLLAFLRQTRWARGTFRLGLASFGTGPLLVLSGLPLGALVLVVQVAIYIFMVLYLPIFTDHRCTWEKAFGRRVRMSVSPR